MRYLAYLAIATFFSISVLVSTIREWFGFIYGITGSDKTLPTLSVRACWRSSWCSASHPGQRSTASLSPLASLAAAALLVTLDEVSQLAIPSRTFELKDLAWSLAGVLVFGLAAAGIKWVGRLYDPK